MLLVVLAATDADAQTCAAPFSISCNGYLQEANGLAPFFSVDNTNDRTAYPAACTGTSYTGADVVVEFVPTVSQRVYVDVDQIYSAGSTNNLDLFAVSGSGNCATG